MLIIITDIPANYCSTQLGDKKEEVAAGNMKMNKNTTGQEDQFLAVLVNPTRRYTWREVKSAREGFINRALLAFITIVIQPSCYDYLHLCFGSRRQEQGQTGWETDSCSGLRKLHRNPELSLLSTPHLSFYLLYTLMHLILKWWSWRKCCCPATHNDKKDPVCLSQSTKVSEII